jgi:hypothetical protein
MLQGGPAGLLGLVMGGGLQRLQAAHGRDVRLLDELGDQSQLASCPHDDLPAAFPTGETGFDKFYTVAVQEKPADLLELVVE